MIWSAIAAVAGLAAGFALGRARLGHRASRWAEETHESASEWALRRYRWPALCVMAVEIAWLAITHPLQSRRNWQSWKPDEPQPDPVTSAHLLAEALDTLFVVCRALLAWIAVGAFVLTVCLFTAMAVIAQGVKGARRALGGPRGGVGASGGSPVLPDAPEAISARTGRSAPSWAHGDTEDRTDIGEAA